MKSIGFIVCVVLAIAMTGCQTLTHEVGPIQGQAVPGASFVQMNTVVVLDKILQDEQRGKIAIEQHAGRRTDTGTMQVYVTVRNRTDFPQQIQLRTSFFDSDQFIVDGPSAWQTLFLPANGTDTYKSLSASFDTTSYRVEIQELR